MYIKVSIPEHFQLKIMPSLYSLMFRRENDVHYIGGAEVLPAPLDAKEKRSVSKIWGKRTERRGNA